MLQDTAAVRTRDAAPARAANPAEWLVAPLCRQLSQAFVALPDQRLDDDARTLLEPLALGPNRGTYFQAEQACVLLADLLLRQGRPVLQRLAAADWGARIDAAGRAALAAWAGPLHARPAAAAPPSALAPLSEREREVLALLARGDSNKLIARAFSLSPHTVKRHVANILDKLGVDTRGQAAASWREQAR